MLPLTEAWATNYLQMLVVFLAFYLGLPLMVFELTVPGRMRASVLRRAKGRVRLAGYVCATIALLILAFLWVLHPVSGRVIVGRGAVFATIIPTLALLGILVVWWVLIWQPLAEVAVASMSDEVERRVGSDELKAPPAALVDDLRCIGEHAATSSTRSEVLRAFRRMAVAVQLKRGYDGTTLKSLVDQMGQMVCAASGTWSEDDLSTSVIHLLEMRGRLVVSGVGRKRKDLDAIDIALATVGKIAVQRGYSELCHRILERAGMRVSVTVALGISALDLGNSAVATNALDKLLTAAEEGGFTDRKANAAFLGVVAQHLLSGPSAKAAALRLFSPRAGSFGPSVADALEDAMGFHRDEQEYRMADGLSHWLDALPGSPRLTDGPSV